MVNVKVEDAVAENTSESGVDLSSAARNSYKQLQISMKSVYMVYNDPFRRLQVAVE